MSQNGVVEQQGTEAAKAALEAAGLFERGDGVPDSITLQNGVVLRITPVPPWVIRQAVMRVPEPPVPTVFLEDKGREEANPNDPEYQEALRTREQEQYLAAGNVALLMGTAIESIPDGVYRPEDDGWLEDLRFLGVAPDETDLQHPKARYIAWLRYYALRTEGDITMAAGAPLWKTNITEREVAQIVASFRSGERRGTDNGSPDAAERPDGDSIPPNRARRRARDRGT